MSTGAASPRPWLRLGTMLAVFLGLTTVGVIAALPSRAALRALAQALLGLDARTLLLVGALALAVMAAEMWRFVVIGRALGVRIGLAAAFDATVANNFFSWIT